VARESRWMERCVSLADDIPTRQASQSDRHGFGCRTVTLSIYHLRQGATPVRIFLAIGIIGVLIAGCADTDATASMSGTGSPSPTQPQAPLPTEMPDPSDAAETAGPPPLNELEVAVIDALAELGLTGMRAELPFDNAAIWVRVDERRALTVSALRIDSDRSEFVVVRTRMTGGIEVATGESSPSSGESLRFHCGDLRYYVGGTAPPPFGDLDAFVDAFISVIDCTPSPTGT